MNYAFLEPVIDPAFRDNTCPSVDSIPFELDESWKTFEKDLGKFKTEYAKARARVNILGSQLVLKNSDINITQIASKVLNSAELKATVASILGEHEIAEGIPELKKNYGEALGRVDAMKSVLLDTNPERYARFTCFVCMDSLVDSLLDPCNHVICERCWYRSNSQVCPGCRAPVREVRKMYTLS